MDNPDRSLLTRGLSDLRLDMKQSSVDRLMAYLDLMVRWNRAYNLTAVRDPREMVTRHLLDSLAIAGHLQGRHIIDVGTGPGLPGIPLAITDTDQSWTLLDSNGKKTRFLFQVKTQLQLQNVTIVEDRVENFRPDFPFDAVISRAFANLGKMVEVCRHLVAEDGRMYAMKGASVDEELAALPDDAELVSCHDLRVPGLNESRYLVELKVNRSACRA